MRLRKMHRILQRLRLSFYKNCCFASEKGFYAWNVDVALWWVGLPWYWCCWRSHLECFWNNEWLFLWWTGMTVMTLSDSFYMEWTWRWYDSRSSGAWQGWNHGLSSVVQRAGIEWGGAIARHAPGRSALSLFLVNASNCTRWHIWRGFPERDSTAFSPPWNIISISCC